MTNSGSDMPIGGWPNMHFGDYPDPEDEQSDDSGNTQERPRVPHLQEVPAPAVTPEQVQDTPEPVSQPIPTPQPTASVNPELTGNLPAGRRKATPSEGSPKKDTLRARFAKWRPRLGHLARIVVLLTYAAIFWPFSWQGWVGFSIILLWIVYVTFLQRRMDSTTTRPAPKQGWQLVAHRVGRLFGVSYVPQLSLREQNDIEKRRQFELAPYRYAFFVVFGLAGGVGKSTTVCNMAWYSSDSNFVPNLIIDARNKRGDIAERMGLWRRPEDLMATPMKFTAPTLRQAIKLWAGGWFHSPAQTMQLLGHAEGRNLHVIVSDGAPSSDVFHIDMGSDGFGGLMDTLSGDSGYYPIIYAECSDDVNTPFDEELMKRGTVPVFAHLTTKANSEGNMNLLLDTYSEKPEFRRKIREHGLLVVLAAERGKDEEYYSKLFRGTIPPERVILIGHYNFYKEDHTDKGHVDASLADYRRPPRRTQEFSRGPLRAEVNFRRGINNGLETLPIRRLKPILSDGSDTHSSDGPLASD